MNDRIIGEVSGANILNGIVPEDGTLEGIIEGEEIVGTLSGDSELECNIQDNGLTVYVELSGGSGDAFYTHSQMVASAEWQVLHNLGKYPSVSVVDTAGNIVVGEVKYITANLLTITFTSAFSGKAYLN